MITTKQVAKLAQICAEINRVRTNRVDTGSKPTVFFMFFGHTHSVELRVHYSGWAEGERPDCIYMFFDGIGWYKQLGNSIGDQIDFENILQELREIREDVPDEY